MRILLTGFGAFPGVEDNPSARIAEAISATGRAGLTGRVLPVSYAQTASIVPELLLGQPPFDAAVLLGVAAREMKIRLERFGRDRTTNAKPDVDGVVPGHAVVTGDGDGVYETPVPLDNLLLQLHADGFPAHISEDAGGYVCNHVYTTALSTIRRHRLPTRCVFVHVPPDTPEFPLATQIAAVELILGFLAVRGEKA